MKRSATIILSCILMLCLSAVMSWGGAGAPLIRDTKGKVIGVALGHVEETVQVMMSLGGVPTTLAVTPTRIGGQQKLTIGVFWESTDCTGTPLLPVALYDSGSGGMAVQSSTTLYVPVSGPSTVRTIESLFDFVNEDRGCQEGTQLTRPVVEALAFPLTIFDVFTPPFTITGARRLP